VIQEALCLNGAEIRIKKQQMQQHSSFSIWGIAACALDILQVSDGSMAMAPQMLTSSACRSKAEEGHFG
jgi:hypothetical protein